MVLAVTVAILLHTAMIALTSRVQHDRPNLEPTSGECPNTAPHQAFGQLPQAACLCPSHHKDRSPLADPHSKEGDQRQDRAKGEARVRKAVGGY